MGVDRPLDITADQRKTILSLLERHLPNTTAWVYGSRAKWTSRPQSDLDLVVFATPEQNGRVSDLREAFEESSLPFRVDLFVWDAVPEKFRKYIKRDHVVLWPIEPPNEWRQGIRDEWQETTLGECVEINDSTYSPKEAWFFVNYLDTGNMTENQISEIQHLIVGEDKIPSRARRKVRPGDIVYSTVRPNQKHFGLLKKVPENFLASTGFSVIRGKDGFAHTNFIYWFLAQDRIVEQLHTIAEHSTSAYPSIRPADIKGLSLDLPPLPEQRTIAHILGTLDDKIGLNRRMNATLEAMARALFKSWFVDFDPIRAKMEGRDTGLPNHIADLFASRLVDSELGKIPEGWKVNRIEEVAERVAMGPFGSSIKVSTFVDKGIPVISGQHLNGTLLDDNKYRFITEAHAEKLKQANVQRGDVIFTHAGSIGQAACIPQTSQFERYVVSQRQFYMRCDVSQISPLFMVHFFKTAEGQHKLLANTSSTGVPSISRPVTYLRSIKLCLPPKTLCDQFDQITSDLYLKFGWTTAESRTLTALRDALLPKLISGEIRVKDAGVFFAGAS